MNHFGICSNACYEVIRTRKGENVNFSIQNRDQRAEYPIYMLEHQLPGFKKITSGVKILFHVELMQIQFFPLANTREQARANSIRSSKRSSCSIYFILWNSNHSHTNVFQKIFRISMELFYGSSPIYRVHCLENWFSIHW